MGMEGGGWWAALALRLRSCLEIARQVTEAAAAIRGPEDPMEQRSGQAWRDGT